jgi:hypothetical protein
MFHWLISKQLIAVVSLSLPRYGAHLPLWRSDPIRRHGRSIGTARAYKNAQPSAPTVSDAHVSALRDVHPRT